MTPTRTPMEQYIDLVARLAQELPFEAEPAHYENAQEDEAP